MDDASPSDRPGENPVLQCRMTDGKVNVQALGVVRPDAEVRQNASVAYYRAFSQVTVPVDLITVGQRTWSILAESQDLRGSIAPSARRYLHHILNRAARRTCAVLEGVG